MVCCTGVFGVEKNVQRILEERIAREEMGDYFGQILVPVEKVVDIRNGRKTISEESHILVMC